MYLSYKQIAKNMPSALIAVDFFHVIKQLNNTIKAFIIKVINKYKANKEPLKADTRYFMFKKFYYFFMKNIGYITNEPIKIYKLKANWRKYKLKRYLLQINDGLTLTYNLAEEYREFNRSKKLVIVIQKKI